MPGDDRGGVTKYTITTSLKKTDNSIPQQTIDHRMHNVFLFALAGLILLTNSAVAQAGDRQRIHEQLLSVSLDSLSRGFPVDLADPDAKEKKSVFLAVVFSLIIPGAGEYYADGYSRGKYFTIAETGLWLTYTGFQVYGTHVRNDARDYAAYHAGVHSEGKDDDYYVNIGNFDNVYQYNDKKLQDRRLDLIYDPVTEYSWHWNSTTERQRYRDLRISSDNILYNSRFIIAAIIANHIVSAISAGKAASDYNKALSVTTGGIQWRLCPQVVSTRGIPDGFSLGIETRF